MKISKTQTRVLDWLNDLGGPVTMERAFKVAGKAQTLHALIRKELVEEVVMSGTVYVALTQKGADALEEQE